MTISGSQTLGRSVPSIAWLAGESRMAHAQLVGAARTVCGEPATLLRYAYPETSRCGACERWVEVRR